MARARRTVAGPTATATPTATPTATAALDVGRCRVLAFRAHTHGLHRSARAAADLPSLVLGIQDSPPGAARLALAARLADPEAAATWDADPTLSVAWTVRGAPHVHRIAELAALATALWPHDDADAAARLAWNATRVAASGRPALEGIASCAAAVAEVAHELAAEVELAKGVLSAEVTRRLPDGLSRWCEPCGSTHVHEQLLRLATLPGGLMVRGSAPLTFGLVPGWSGVPAPPTTASGTEGVARAYLHLYGPATPGDLKAFLGCTLDVAKAVWPDDVVPVTVDGRAAWALPDDVPP